MHTPWLDIPLADYEAHMSLSSVGQADMLSTLFAQLLAKFSPPSLAVIGCAGGNGFDHIQPETSKRAVGVDINPRYIQAAFDRYAEKIPGLELYVGDIQAAAPPFAPVDLIYAALVFEYVSLVPTLRNLKSVCRPHGLLAAVLQLPSASLAPISPSPFTSRQALAPVMQLVDPAALAASAADVGFMLFSSHTIILPSGKKFAVQVFQQAPGLGRRRYRSFQQKRRRPEWVHDHGKAIFADFNGIPGFFAAQIARNRSSVRMAGNDTVHSPACPDCSYKRSRVPSPNGFSPKAVTWTPFLDNAMPSCAAGRVPVFAEETAPFNGLQACHGYLPGQVRGIIFSADR